MGIHIIGYTHYLKRPLVIDNWDKIIEGCFKAFNIVRNLGIEIVGGSGDPGTYAEINQHYILLNGSYKQTPGIGSNMYAYATNYRGFVDVRRYSHMENTCCESLSITKQYDFEFGSEADEVGNYFTFCKTRRWPYDLIVMTCYLIVRHWEPKCELSTDGDLEEWRGAMAIASDICNADSNTFVGYID